MTKSKDKGNINQVTSVLSHHLHPIPGHLRIKMVSERKLREYNIGIYHQEIYYKSMKISK